MSQPQDLLDSVSGQLRNLPLLATPETCSGRSYIVTGANSGLGFEAAKHLVSLGAAKVILAVRNLSAGEKAKADIEASTGRTSSSEVWHLDLSSYESVNDFAKRATLKLDRIDALIENAGVAIDMSNQAEGHPATFTVNVFSTFLLAMLLLPKMKADAQRLKIAPHITIVSSSVAFFTQPLWDLGKDDANPMNKIVQVGQLDMTSGYTVSKLLEVLAVRHIASLIPVSSTGVVLNLVCPGLCKTDIGRNATDDVKAVAGTMMDQIGRTSEDGSRTLLFAAIAGKDSHGRFTADCEIKDDAVIPDWIKGGEAEEGRKRLWNVIANEIELAAPGSIAKVFS
ncbi:hypothetical protein BFJ68_g8828 [Fusarium oxysporum]|uniref:Uncharacterized protein n=2 Tax=Fusarium oxysporum TaxID=5507 RepID=A0A420PUX7_FUSOX|nr:hypothetical protein BFJ65_g15214 [Fusarium oxysporum f. sp. cepae]RKK34263.1 hypothetical protein BFJ67_g13851 [Fusarium oxysporum f. sp. cepae]RKK41480.1 hypothetical protein BFJ66_g10978 [Fusarium oxysporum f. sp. cepae]RKK96309.1 hypothetical protein BFJ71_g7889 [Fusarium oxysporum]RKL10212.1 hypothetical protein BFJ68_g8828 [Fusarium oxysporum]